VGSSATLNDTKKNKRKNTMSQHRLGQIAHARSGDKGSGANIGVIAYTPEGYAFLKQHLTADRVEAFFKPMDCGKVERHEWESIGAFNFLIPGILAGGGSRSLRIDAQGKALGQILLEMPIEIDDATLAKCQSESAPA
jgi:hypothetical protein